MSLLTIYNQYLADDESCDELKFSDDDVDEEEASDMYMLIILSYFLVYTCTAQHHEC